MSMPLAAPVVEPFQRRADTAAQRIDDARIGLAMVLLHHVGGEQLGRVLDAGRALIAFTAGW